MRRQIRGFASGSCRLVCGLFLVVFCARSAISHAEPAAKPRLTFGIQTAHQVPSLDDLIQLWQDAEGWGYDTLWLNDHMMQFGKEDGPAYDAWALLPALAQTTSRARIGVLVTDNLFRHPTVLAKMATTVDLLSKGRLEMGMGGGWFQREHEAYGIDFPSTQERLARLEEALQVLKALWTQDEVSFSGKYYRVVKARFVPKAAQKPYPPITIGGQGEKRTLPLVAKYADKWSMPAGFTPEKFAEKVKKLEAACAAIQRDCSRMDKSYQTFLVFSSDQAKIDLAVQQLTRYYKGMTAAEAKRTIIAGTTADDLKKQIREFAAAGVTHFIFTARTQPYDREGFQRLAREVIPEFR